MSRMARYRRELRDRWLAVRLGLAGRQHQYGEINALRRFIRHFGIDCVIDVGANAGQYAQMLRRDVGFAGDILSFEPNPAVFIALERAAAGDARWQVFNAALTDQDGPILFNIMAADQFSSINAPDSALEPIFADRNSIAAQVEVAGHRLETLLPTLIPVLKARGVLLKMDTQGHDHAVCAGAGAVLARMAGVQTELAVRPLYKGGTDYRAMISLLEVAGFRPSAMFANNKGHFPLLVEMDGLFVRADLAKGGNVPLI
jgi:FkbM family methyltransferase